VALSGTSGPTVRPPDFTVVGPGSARIVSAESFLKSRILVCPAEITYKCM